MDVDREGSARMKLSVGEDSISICVPNLTCLRAKATANRFGCGLRWTDGPSVSINFSVPGDPLKSSPKAYFLKQTPHLKSQMLRMETIIRSM